MKKPSVRLTKNRIDFVSKNWQIMTDSEIGIHLSLSKGNIAAIRQHLRLLRKEPTHITKETKSYVINGFFNDMRTKSIMAMTGLTYSQVTYIIEKYCFYKKRSYDTITLIMDSKVNY